MSAFVPAPPLFSGFSSLSVLAVPKRHRKAFAAPHVICSKRASPSPTTKNGVVSKKGPQRPVTKHTPPTPRLQHNVSRGRGGPAELVRSALHSRRDALIVGASLPGKLSATLSARERSERGLVLVATRSEARRAAAEIALDARGSPIILVAGVGGDSWAHPAMNANSSPRAAIVVATPRALVAEFCNSPHGRPWLSRVRFLAVADPHRLLDTGCEKLLKRIFKALRVRDHRKNVVLAMRLPEGDVGKLVKSLLRDKVDTVNWGVPVPPVQLLQAEELKSDTRVRLCDQFYESSTASGVCASLSSALHAHIEREGKHKLVVFFATARLAEYFALLFRGRGFEVLDVHGKTSLSKREQFLETFYSAEKAVVFSSDTLARDMLLPPIDQVLQIGFPASSEQYLRRVALVADGAKGRSAVLLLLQSETEEAMKIIGEAMHAERRECVEAENWQVSQGDDIPEKAKARAYQSWLAYYRRCRRKIGWDRPELVRQANVWAVEALGKIPALDKKTIDTLFLRGIEGIRCTTPATSGHNLSHDPSVCSQAIEH